MFHIYGFLIGVGIVAGASVASYMREKKGQDGGLVWEVLWWALIPGVVGARAYHVADYWLYYRDNLLEIPQIWLGGLGIIGGIFGGLAGIGLYSYLHSLKKEKVFEEVFFEVADLSVMALALAQSIGRWGNYFNGELYGTKTTLPWGVVIPGREGIYHPLFLYESLLDLLLFFVLLAVYHGHSRGSSFGAYLIGYGVIRMVLEFFRFESWRVGEIGVAQIFGFAFVVAGIVVLRRRQNILME